jgi:hypothetical protein
VNFGEGPKDGVQLWGKHIAGEALETQDCPESGRLQRKAGVSKRCWFQLKKPFVEAVRTMERRYPADAVVQQLLAVFPEVEAWWQHRTVGPHLTISRKRCGNWQTPRRPLANDSTTGKSRSTKERSRAKRNGRG